MSQTSTVSRTCVYCGLPVPPLLARGLDANEAGYCCYGCRFAHGIAQARTQDEGTSWLLVRLGTAIFLSMNVMIFGLFLYSGDMFDPSSTAEANTTSAGFADLLRSLFRYGSMLFAAPVLAILGTPIVENAFQELRARRVTVDLLFAAGVMAAFLYSVMSTVSERGEVYFDTTCMILVLVTLGRWFEAGGKLRATQALEALGQTLPDEVRKIVGDDMVDVPTSSLQVGDVVVVDAGQRVPADGEIVVGTAHFDEQLVTGESAPVHRDVGDGVFCGTLAVEGPVQVRVSAVGEGATLGRLARLVREARQHKGRYERLADRLASVFVPVVMVLAVTAGVVTGVRHGIEAGIMTLLAVTLISCPCALGLATPLAVWTAMGVAAQRGVWFRNSEALEKLADLRTIVFDKTGTLTDGAGHVTGFLRVDRNGMDDDDVLSLAAAVARQSNHHLSRAIDRHTRTMRPADVRDVISLAGRGMSANLVTSGDRVFLGNERLMLENGISVGDGAADRVAELTGQGSSAVMLAVRDSVRAVFGVSESLRSDAADTMSALRGQGVTAVVMTGDHQARADAMAEKLGVDASANLLPEDKLERTRLIVANGRTAVVGDGVNDAPALAAADVGIAMGCGADVTRETADACLVDNNLSRLPELIDLSKRTVATIKRNLFWACIYNVVGIGFAMTGRLHPIVASLAMVVSSAIVVANSRRLAWGAEDVS